MYNRSTYGYGVYKRSQVNIGNPYQPKKPAVRFFDDEDEYEEAPVHKRELDKDLLISQDIVYKAKEEAAVLVREAELEAERILSKANGKAEELFAETEQKSREEGCRQGEALARQHYQELLSEAESYRDQCKQEYEDTLNSLEQEIVELVINIAAKVLGDEIRNNRQAILDIARETINSCSNHEHVLLKVSAEDYDFVVENEESLRSMVGDLNELEIKKDSTLKRGSCIIDTGFGSVDGSCDTIIENIKQAFLNLSQSAEPGEN